VKKLVKPVFMDLNSCRGWQVLLYVPTGGWGERTATWINVLFPGFIAGEAAESFPPPLPPPTTRIARRFSQRGSLLGSHSAESHDV
jgi:hypothetical protein